MTIAASSGPTYTGLLSVEILRMAAMVSCLTHRS